VAGQDDAQGVPSAVPAKGAVRVMTCAVGRSAVGTADSRQGSTGSSRCQDVWAPVIFAGVG